MKWNLGDKVTSIAIEGYGSTGTIADVDFDRVRVIWEDNKQSYENYEDLILKSAREHELMITIEEGSIGGFGSHVKNLLAEKGIFDKGLKFRSMTLPDEFIEQDNPKNMYDIAGLNSPQITKKVLEVLFNKDSIRVVKN